ncbi:MAG: hypothetical protein QM668_19050 [Agriterribacter sp.]
MKVKILKVEDNEDINAQIKLAGSKTSLPSLTDGWRFNFKSNTRKEKLATYVLVCDETPQIIEGCLSFKMKDLQEPYMAYIEIAPHNKGKDRQYDHVAACLIAFACRLSFIHGEGDFKGWLAFDVLEQQKDDEIKLMALYSKKYGALRFGQTTTMYLSPEKGEQLIKGYLKK